MPKKSRIVVWVLLVANAMLSLNAHAQKAADFHVVAIAEANGGIHQPYVDSAKHRHNRLASKHQCARNVYIFMGHGPWHFENEAHRRIFGNAIFWAGGK